MYARVLQGNLELFRSESATNQGKLRKIPAIREGVRATDGSYQPAEERIDVESKVPEWSSRFGEKTAEALCARVEAEMGNYEYLKHFKLKC